MTVQSKPTSYLLAGIFLVMALGIIQLFLGIKNSATLTDFVNPGLLSMVLLANSFFFLARMSKLTMDDHSITVKYTLLGKEVKIPFDDIIGYDAKSSAVLLFKTTSGKVFAIRKFEFENYSAFENTIRLKSTQIQISNLSNAINGLYAYLAAGTFVSLTYYIIKIVLT